MAIDLCNKLDLLHDHGGGYRSHGEFTPWADLTTGQRPETPSIATTSKRIGHSFTSRFIRNRNLRDQVPRGT